MLGEEAPIKKIGIFGASHHLSCRLGKSTTILNIIEVFDGIQSFWRFHLPSVQSIILSTIDILDLSSKFDNFSFGFNL